MIGAPQGEATRASPGLWQNNRPIPALQSGDDHGGQTPTYRCVSGQVWGNRAVIGQTSIPDTGLEVIDLPDETWTASRPVQRHDAVSQIGRTQRIARAFVDSPGSILQELVDAAIELCGADSAGISLERPNGTAQNYYHWVATAGQYSEFFNAMLPQTPSACGVCLERNRPQIFRVGRRFFDILGVQAPLVTDGLLLPWICGETRGTIFIMAHGRDEAFDAEHCRIMSTLADFAALGIRHQRQQSLLMAQAAAVAAASMANRLAHEINNPLQSLTNVLFLAASGQHGEEAQQIGEQAMKDLQRVSSLVKELLELPYRERTIMDLANG